MIKNNYLQILENSLRELFVKFTDNPYYYFYEEDIRVELAQTLINKLDPIEVNHFDKKIMTSPVKCEYPSNMANKQRHDIVLIKQNSLQNIYNLDLPVIIELKLGSKSYDRCAEFKEDIKKLLGYNSEIFTGITIYFYQDDNDLLLFNKWFEDIIDESEFVQAENLVIEKNKVNTFIVNTNKSVLKATSYKNY